jgi:hypothetical protein
MKIDYYGEKRFEERVKEYVSKRIKSKLIYGIAVYMASVPKECWDCVYFPCEEECKITKKRE